MTRREMAKLFGEPTADYIEAMADEARSMYTPTKYDQAAACVDEAQAQLLKAAKHLDNTEDRALHFRVMKHIDALRDDLSILTERSSI